MSIEPESLHRTMSIHMYTYICLCIPLNVYMDPCSVAQS